MANGKVTRKNIDSLQGNDLATLQEGYAKMQAILDNRGFNFIAGLHGIPNFLCPHHTPFFLPWHRAYLYYFELFLQDQIDGLALPWWDWTRSNNQAPRAFTAPTRADGQPNPLLKFRIQRPLANPPVVRDTRRFPGQLSSSSPITLPTPDDVDALLNITDFVQFSAALEQIHDSIHVWTGGSGTDRSTGRRVSGDMSVISFAAYDPIFFSHHCMIDRVWYLWQLKNGINNLPPALMRQSVSLPNMAPIPVSELLDINNLGYEYAVDQITVVASSAGNQ